VASEGRLRIGPLAISPGALLGGTLLAGRLSGLLREIQLASAFGVSVESDVAILLLTLPDLLVNLLLSGGLSAALIPRLRTLPASDSQILLRQTTWLVSIFFGLLAIFLGLAPEFFFALLAPGLKSDSMPATAAIAMTALAIPLAAVSGVTSAGLNARQQFFVAGCGTFIFNTAVIISLVLARFDFENSLVLLGLGIAAGAAFRLISQAISLPRGWLWGPIGGAALDMKFIRSFMTTAFTASIVLLVPVIIRSIASTVSPGAISAINYATKLVELPAGVLVTSLATVALSQLSGYYATHDKLGARQVLNDSVRRAISNAIGAGAVIAYFSHAFVELALARGAMSPDAIARVVCLTQVMMIGLPFLALAGLAVADLNAREQPLIVLKATLGSLLALPVFALPGLWFKSELMLAWAVVGFQALYALWVGYTSGLLKAGGWGWCNRKLVTSILIIAVIVAVAVLIDLWLKSSQMSTGLMQSALGVVALGAVVFFPHHLLANIQNLGKQP